MSTSQAKHEKDVTQIFAEWQITRAEKKFLHLADELRWDFVASLPDRADWFALEVKCLVIPGIQKQLGSWQKATKEFAGPKITSWFRKRPAVEQAVHRLFEKRERKGAVAPRKINGCLKDNTTTP